MSSISYYEKDAQNGFLGGHWDPFLRRGTNGVGWVTRLGQMGFGVNNATNLGGWPHDPFAQASSHGTAFMFFFSFYDLNLLLEEGLGFFGGVGLQEERDCTTKSPV